MKNFMPKKLLLFKLIIISRLILNLVSIECNRSYPIFRNNECVSTYCNETQFSKGECIIDNPIIRTTWLTNIIIFENTNGEIDFFYDYRNLEKIMLKTSFSNSTERLYYGMEYKDDKQYIFYDDDKNYFPYIKKNTNLLETNGITNSQSGFIDNGNYCFIISIGTKNSNIEILDLDNYSNDLIIISRENFLNSTNRIIRGISSFIGSVNYYLIYGLIISEIDDPSNNYFSLFSYEISYNTPENFITLIYSKYFELVKGEIISCFNFEKGMGHLSCIYLSEDYNYTIINIFNNIINNQDSPFTVYYKKKIGFLANTTNENIFFKGIFFDTRKGIYCFFSGDSNEIPTFLFKEIDKNTFNLTDLYSEFPVVYLKEYSFNNDFKYNDIVLCYIEEKKFYFASTDIDKKFLIIAQFQIFTSSSDQKNKLLIRYYIIKLQEYYNIKILNGLKAIVYNSHSSDYYLSLAIDFGYNDIFQNSQEINNNEALIFFSYANVTSKKDFDFIEYAFKNNLDYFVANFTENFVIENNIFGYKLDGIGIMDQTIEDGINYYDFKSGQLLDFVGEESWDFYREVDQDSIKVDLTDYSLEKITIYINYGFYLSTPIKLEDYNQYCDNYNNEYGDIYDEEFYEEPIQRTAPYFFYYININKNLSRECNDTNCTLCLSDDRYYCLVCKDDNYTIIYNDSFKYGKNKICIKEEEIIGKTIAEEESSNSIDSTLNTELIISNSLNIYDELTYENSYIEKTIFSDFDSISYEKLSEIVENTNSQISNVPTIINNENSDNLSNFETMQINSDISNELIVSTNLKTISSTNLENIVSTNLEIMSDTQILNTEISNNNNTKELSLVDLFGDKYKDIELTNEQIKELYKNLKNYILNDYNGNPIIINTGNVKIQISTLDDQKNEDSELSNVDLGNCEKILREKYCKTDEDELVMLKFDVTINEEISTYVQYEIYESNSKTFLELKECSGSDVIINVPIDLESDLEFLYDMLASSGFNLFDSNDSFYNDICAAFSTENGTDILLYDRRMDIYQKTLNISLCQDGCKFLSYNSETKKAECDCPIQTNEIEIDLSEIKFDSNKMVADFYETIKNSNFRVLKCFKLVYNIRVFLKNYGSMIMTFLYLLFFTLMIISKLKSSTKINQYIQNIIRNKFSSNENSSCQKLDNLKKNNKVKIRKDRKDLNKSIKRGSKNENKKNKKTKNGKKRYKRNSVIDNNHNYKLEDILQNEDKEENNVIKNIKQAPNKRKINEKNLGLKNRIDKGSIDKNSYPFLSNSVNRILNENNQSQKKIENNKNNIYNINGININIYNNNHIVNKKISNKNINNSKDEKKGDLNLLKIKTDLNPENSHITEKLNDEEMNSLSYKKALLLDKRSYFQYYISLIKKKQLILFTFIPTNDYNLMSLKISLFIVSFALYLSINAFFFNDETMHKIYKNNGIYNVLSQIPQIIYSSLISALINILLKNLSLSESNILKIKKEEDMNAAVQKSKDIQKCIKIKFIIFFIISSILMLFFWYFISCFCAVYNNTQIILFKDTLISFSLSMLYPFGLNLLPGIFRIPSLRAKKKDKQCLYKFSKLIAFI